MNLQLDSVYGDIFEHIKRYFGVLFDTKVVQEEKLNPTHYAVYRHDNGDYVKYEVTIQEFYDARNSVRIYAGYCKALGTLYYSFNMQKEGK